MDFADVVVKLGPPADISQFTSTVNLASITNTDSSFVFAADQSTVVNGPGGGLELHVRIAVQGEKSLFSRFSYHVQILTNPVVSKIAGTIRWSQADIGDPTPDALSGAVNTFRVVAGAFVFGPTGGLGGPGASVWTERVSTLTDTAPVLASGFWAVPYTLENVPLGEQLQIVPALLGGLNTPPANPTFVPVPQFVTLTLGSPSAVGIDFELQAGGGVH